MSWLKTPKLTSSLWQQLKTLSPDSEEHGDLLGYALAQARQLGMDAEDVAETEEKILELPDDES